MPEVVLATLNAQYAHASLGLRSIFANLGELQSRTLIREFTIKEAPLSICEELLALNCRVLGLGVYIWNVAQTTEVVKLLKRLRPEMAIVLGGPEVSYETAEQEIVQAADHVVTGEGEATFPGLCQALLEGKPGPRKTIPGILPDVKAMALPYEFYSDRDVRERLIYVEASRGCPFKCEFCLSSLDTAVRDVPLDRFLGAMDRLLERGVTQFKFIDRTFNLKVETSRAILEFFLERLRPGLFLHFELIPDRLPDALRDTIARFPAGSLQFEVGIQTFDAAVTARISRRQDVVKVEDNFKFLREHTGVHVHADLIIGLPGETFDSFGAGFDRLLSMKPQEVQVGLLKRLRGTPIIRHDQEWRMVYSPNPPYEILQTRDLNFLTVLRLRRFAKYWELVHNSGNFRETTGMLLGSQPSPFSAFLAFADWLYAKKGRTHSIALDDLAECLFQYLVSQRGMEESEVGPTLLADYVRTVPRRTPEFLTPYSRAIKIPQSLEGRSKLPARQARHLVPNAD